jgi:cyclopropane-fatty-acyl-phospholipid synthase
MSMDVMDQAASRPAALARHALWKRLVTARVKDFANGELIVRDDDGEVRLGTPAADGLRVHMRIHRPRLWRRVALGGLLAATEAYVDGDWDADDLTALARLFSRNMGQVERLDSGLGRLIRPVARTREWLSRNSRDGSRRNIAAHYDLGNDFFELMLDPTMTYSCGVFERADATLEEASIAKIDRLCRKLELHAGDHLLEIGSGWGALAIHAASRYGCRVTTTTISTRQYELVKRRVAEAGLSDRITVLLSDYRDLRGQYSKLVSVEMIEAVGAEYFDTFFRTCVSLLRPDGLMAIQAITVADQRFESARKAVDFIKHHVFPGSCIPSIGALTSSSSRVSDLRLVDLEDFSQHYAKTLACWRENLSRNDDAVARITDARFRRLWMLYLAYCEGGFAERHTGLVQMVYARPDWRVGLHAGREVRPWSATS